MSIDTETKKICKEAEAALGDVRDVISEEYHQRFIDLLSDFLKRLDHLARQRGNLSKIDSVNIGIARTSVLFINQIMVFVFDQKDLFVSDARPDLVPYIERLSDSINGAREEGPIETSEVSLTLLNLVMRDAELFIAHYYNPPKRSVTQSVVSRVVERLMLMIRGVKG